MPQNGVSRAKTVIVTEKPADSSVTIARKVCAWTPVAVLWGKCYRYPKISPHLLRFHWKNVTGGVFFMGTCYSFTGKAQQVSSFYINLQETKRI